MNVVENAQEHSLMYRWVQSAGGVTAPWDYSLQRNVPPYTQHYTKVKQESQILGGSQSWRIPRLGLLAGIKLEVELTFPAAAAAYSTAFEHQWAGAHLIKSVILRSATKDIAKLYPEELIDYATRGNREDFEDLLSSPSFYAGEKLISLTPGGTGVSKHTMLIPLPFSFTERLSNTFLTSFCEDIDLVVEYQSNADLQKVRDFSSSTDTDGILRDGGDTTAMFTPRFEWIVPNPAEHNKLQQQMVAAGSDGLPRIQYTVYKEADRSLAVGAGGVDQPVVIDMYCPHATARTLIALSASAEPTKYVKIKKFEVVLNGVTYLELNEADLLLREAMPPFDKSKDTLVYTIDWTMVSSLLEQGGFLPMRNFATKQLKLTLDTLTEAHKVVVHQYIQVIEQTAPGNGNIIIRAFD